MKMHAYLVFLKVQIVYLLAISVCVSICVHVYSYGNIKFTTSS